MTLPSKPQAPAGIVVTLTATQRPTNARYRNRVDELIPLVNMAALRLQTADQVAITKYQTGSPIDDPRREQQVIQTVAAAAIAKGIDPEFVKVVFRDQIDAANAIEHARFADWKLDPSIVPAAGSDLLGLRTTIDRLNDVIVEEITTRWGVLNSGSSCTGLDRARSMVSAAWKFDNLYQRSLIHATRSYCRPRQRL